MEVTTFKFSGIFTVPLEKVDTGLSKEKGVGDPAAVCG